MLFANRAAQAMRLGRARVALARASSVASGATRAVGAAGVRSTTGVRAAGTTRLFGTADSFDDEVAAIYKKISENHTHPKGPWALMTAEVVSFLGDGQGG